MFYPTSIRSVGYLILHFPIDPRDFILGFKNTILFDLMMDKNVQMEISLYLESTSLANPLAETIEMN